MPASPGTGATDPTERTTGGITTVTTSRADATYDTESSQNASGSALPRNATKRPANGYPNTSASVSLSHVTEFAVTSSSSRTTLGVTAVRAGRKKMETVVSRKTSG